MAIIVPFTTRKNAVKHFTMFRFTLHSQTLHFKWQRHKNYNVDSGSKERLFSLFSG